MIYASGMETNLSRLLNFLPALVLVGFMIGCGGSTTPNNKLPKGDGKKVTKSKAENNSSLGEGNQSEPPKPENNSSLGGGKAATDTANKPKATKFTPEMVKAAFEAAIKQNPNLFTEKEKARALAQMQEPKRVQGMTDELNKNISGGKIIDFDGMNVDEITVEALAKGIVAMMPQARKEGSQWNSYMKIGKIKSILSDYILDQYIKNIELDRSVAVGKYPAADKWCDVLLKADKERVQKAVKELHACDKNGDKKINKEEFRRKDSVFFSGSSFRQLDTNKNGFIDFPDEAFNPKLSLESFYSPQMPETEKLLAAKPAARKRTSHYAFNAAVAGKPKDIAPKTVRTDGGVSIVEGRKNFPDDKVLLFECDLGWNGTGGLEDALKYMEKYKLEKIPVAFVEGVKRPLGGEVIDTPKWRCTKEELKKLNW